MTSKQELLGHQGTKPLLGIFNSDNMDTWIDRNIYPESLYSKGDPKGQSKIAGNQPGLEEMTMAAINILEQHCDDGFYLMVEAASVDKAMHSMDYDRGLGELLELDRTVKLVNDWRLKNSAAGTETALIVTSDHAQAFDVVGVVDTEYLAELPNEDHIKGVTLTGKQADLQYFKRKAMGIYDYAGWPDMVTDSTGMPTNWEGRYRLWSGKVDFLQHREDFKIKKKYREPVIEDKTLSKQFGGPVYVINPEETGLYYSPSTYPDYPSTEHSLQSVDLYCAGPTGFTAKCAKVMDNTELFFIMADALGLGTTDNLATKLPETNSTVTVTVYVEKTTTVYKSQPTIEVYEQNQESAAQNPKPVFVTLLPNLAYQ